MKYKAALHVENINIKRIFKNDKINGKIIPQNPHNSFILYGLLLHQYLLFVALFFFTILVQTRPNLFLTFKNH